jgi:hypothetical protein
MASEHDTQNFGAVRHPVNGYRLYLKEYLRLLLEQVGASEQ